MHAALLIVNPHSRDGAGEIIKVWQEALEARNVSVELVTSSSVEHTQSAIIEKARNVELVILAGGDGTISSAAPALREANIPFAIIPLGTANDLARSVGFIDPVDIDQACDAIRDRRYRKLDLGKMGDRYFFNVAHIGLGVKVSKALTSESKKQLGVFSYLKAALSAVEKRKGFEAKVTVDGEAIKLKSIQLAIGNSPYYGGGNMIDSRSDIDDGVLSVYSIEPVSLTSLLLLTPALRSGTLLDRKEVFTAKGHSICIETKAPMKITADGEQVAETPAEFSCEASALTIVSLK